jgi:hypothetical protein
MSIQLEKCNIFAFLSGLAAICTKLTLVDRLPNPEGDHDEQTENVLTIGPLAWLALAGGDGDRT